MLLGMSKPDLLQPSDIETRFSTLSSQIVNLLQKNNLERVLIAKGSIPGPDEWDTAPTLRNLYLTAYSKWIEEWIGVYEINEVINDPGPTIIEICDVNDTRSIVVEYAHITDEDFFLFYMDVSSQFHFLHRTEEEEKEIKRQCYDYILLPENKYIIENMIVSMEKIEMALQGINK